ncbi:putative YjgP/YjgQ family permease [Blattabacterium sp. (Blattella germanica) str. Bge]|uniref:LptF/LptG family permease n=1 Tax=Blattabacterium sp. (Blattella germanica) TaxID=624186 RepID=UPI0001BB61CA|nr:LptF/LptG family permease [Blattabacterium sp. (Blattella germanica)]ACY40404.1 putative YjgP/YjgQ family permease [Blattabacterium sp. (Blattella germanica) str. Bge]
MKILDRYIIRNLLITFIFITVSLQLLSVVIDISQRMHRLENNQGSIKKALIFYYPYWSIWLANTFSPISVFLSVIFFTSKLENNSEITAILSSGISLNRLIVPYLISAIMIGTVSLLINYYFLPMANKKKNQFHYQYLLSSRYKNKYEKNQTISTQISKNEYIFIRNFSRKKNIGKEFVYQKFNGKKLIYILKSKNIFGYKKKKIYVLSDYRETTIKKNYDFFIKGDYKIKKFSFTPEELLPEEYIAETMNIYELKKFIDIEKKNRNVNIHLNEYYQRTSLPFSTFIFTILGFSLSSKKSETGYNIILGIVLAVFYIFFMEITKIYSTKDTIPSYLSVWLPNVLLGIIALFFYWKNINN